MREEINCFHSFQLGCKLGLCAAVCGKLHPVSIPFSQAANEQILNNEYAQIKYVSIPFSQAANSNIRFSNDVKLFTFPFLLVRLQTRKDAKDHYEVFFGPCFHSFQLGCKLRKLVSLLWYNIVFPFLLVRLQTHHFMMRNLKTSPSFHSFQLGCKQANSLVLFSASCSSFHSFQLGCKLGAAQDPGQLLRHTFPFLLVRLQTILRHED